MSTWTRREIVTRRVEFAIPAGPAFGACWNQVLNAIRAARTEAEKAGLVAPAAEMSDDAVRVYPREDEIVAVVELGSDVGKAESLAAAERDFILARLAHQGKDRCRGRSSDALTFYGLVDSCPEPDKSQYPSDRDDLAACARTYEMAPPHVQRKMWPLLQRYQAYVSDKYSEKAGES